MKALAPCCQTGYVSLYTFVTLFSWHSAANAECRPPTAELASHEHAHSATPAADTADEMAAACATAAARSHALQCAGLSEDLLVHHDSTLPLPPTCLSTGEEGGAQEEEEVGEEENVGWGGGQGKRMEQGRREG